MKYEVIDNFLDEEYFDSLVTLFTGNSSTSPMPWFLEPSVEYAKTDKNWKPPKNDKIYYMFHLLYDMNIPCSDYYKNLLPLLDKLEVLCSIRIKVNLYPNTETLHEHQMHIDYDFSHSTALLSLNTCDGYTKFEDGTKIDSIANRILLFDASEKHCSSTATNVFARFNININYIQKQLHKMT
jgi:hypothetical protein